MNRIIIIGNGFDLAHGLPTSYNNFINWYIDKRVNELTSCHTNVNSDELCKFKILENTWHSFIFQNYGPLWNNILRETLFKNIKGHPEYFQYTQSRFLEAITRCIEKNNWVDIEKEYYNLLSTDLESSDNENITKLNKELECLKNNLIAYLKEVETKLINESIVKNSIKEKILEPINPRDISIEGNDKFEKSIRSRPQHSPKEWDILLKKYEYKEPYGIANPMSYPSNYKEYYLPESILLLNFNYTKTADLYLPKEDIFKVNHIHGKLSNPKSIIFGYGDELDDNYKKLLKDNNNEYLKNIKSINYLNYTNYREMLSYIESAPYQIYIMGHSCGLSDKTLLNTLFEHDNCVSIKPFYYINKEGRDNYTDIVQNISRNFTDMKLMRDRVVNKTFCETLE